MTSDWLPLIDLPRPLSDDSAPGLVAEVVEQLGRPQFGYPGTFGGRGIVTCAGGGRYLPCAWVLVRMLRQHGCSLPIELWHLGPEELPGDWRTLLADQGVEFVDARRVQAEHRHPRLNGWEVKPYAIRFSRFQEVLFLDADNVPCADPSYLFEEQEYQRHGIICWPDYGNFARTRSAWRVFGEIAYRNEPEHETGQLLVNKAQVWPAVLLANWYNVHSAFYYHHNLGDKDTWHLALRRLGMEFAMPRRRIHTLPATMCQHDLAGRRLFQHRNMAKWSLVGNRRIPGFLFEDDCLGYLQEAARRLAEHAQWHQMGAADRTLAGELTGRWLEYCRVGHDQRPMRLGERGLVEEGAAACEAFWHVAEGKLHLVAADGQLTCALERDEHGIWCGRWQRHERMPVRMVPWPGRTIKSLTRAKSLADKASR